MTLKFDMPEFEVEDWDPEPGYVELTVQYHEEEYDSYEVTHG